MRAPTAAIDWAVKSALFVLHPGHRGLAADVQALELRRHIAREELVGALGCAQGAQLWAMNRKAPKPPDWSTSAWILAAASSGVPTTASGIDRKASTGSPPVAAERQVGDLAEVEQPLLQPEADVGHRLLLGLGDVHRADQAPGGAVNDLPSRAPAPRRSPSWSASALKPPSEVAPIESRPRPCLPAARAPVGETWLATAISTLGARIGAHLQPRAVQLEPVALVADFLAAQQAHDARRAPRPSCRAGGRSGCPSCRRRTRARRADPEHHAARGSCGRAG